jgi:hypothetical protein
MSLLNFTPSDILCSSLSGLGKSQIRPEQHMVAGESEAISKMTASLLAFLAMAYVVVGLEIKCWRASRRTPTDII